ncbi:MAG: hypothetical protein AUJ52_07715 [Elusimicrobia bacterium CG1_02_63_36]|nr:MAG: hypothetical protein AUJ52_07715 [Elusimicrobia bacterium CG1_02_63_36]PIP81927.1 MAG: hypothetical protein COR54_17595 [Elusimicrobia bacterium CG22_combo_CG10-13_8_21_14_all_63_91]PJA14078.1 MAG: hypothetical protein COX66_13510 [Elusimicrobia bacterium CG_4_10_14_0_2_um_filter_63_34]PJB25983.1 MAG: hypothetical protein CO113_05695 [Elusimicrobia bacterium CG_4_9_14_3_um_filter_62_55]
MTTETKVTGDELLAEILGSARTEEETAEKKDGDEDLDLDKLKQRTPPKDGTCRRCGEDRPINRMKLCYKCWVISNLEDQVPGWKAGDPHPAWCQCEGLPGHETTRRGSHN